MQAPAPRNTISLAPILPPVLRPFAEPLDPALRRLLVPAKVLNILTSSRSGSAPQFARHLLEALNIRFELNDYDLKRIPDSGPALVVANHPYGIVEGLILLDLLERVRPDVKILANSILTEIAELRQQAIPVNPYETLEARFKNRRAVREAVEWLNRSGLLIVFPAGEVAHLDWNQPSVTDSPWKTTAARLALRMRCAVVPIFFKGCNSIPFQLSGLLHPGLRTISLAHEFHRLRGKTVSMCIGNPIPWAVLSAYSDPERATAYLRSRTFFLSNRSEFVPVLRDLPLNQARIGTIVSPGKERLLAEEVAALPVESELAGNSEFTVYLAQSEHIPQVLSEIGRCREQAFRAVGEGTGKEIDLDRFDEYYQHLFLWSRADRRLAGAYRLAVTTDVLSRFGIGGLYTSTLFRFHKQFFTRLGPAVELGRSFVLPEYQKNYASLFLLWKGIMRFVQHRPEAPVLFGGVSISRQYQAASRGLMATYLSGRASHELARYVQPRCKYRDKSTRSREIKQFASVAASIEDISLCIADIEDDSKGVPVLLRQYLKAGGRLLAFNLDPDFSDTLDALIVADLRTAPPALLERCMGRNEARAFLASHQTNS